MRRRTRFSPHNQHGLEKNPSTSPPTGVAGFVGLGSLVLCLGLGLGLTGCGTDLDAVMGQTANAAATTFFDVLLTDAANQLADTFDQNEPPAAAPEDPPDEGDDGGDDGDGGGGGGGADLYAANCSACHGADGASGFAPDITGLGADEMATGLESGSHGGISLSDDEVAAVTEFLGG
ncbi:MAG: cytochrome c [bacterium]|nr:cytochrome c [bacterium]